MSGFEPILAEAVVAEAGTSALAAEVMAPELLAATAGAESIGGASGLAGISGLFGTGLEGAAANGGLGALTQSAVPTMAQQLATANPIALGQLQNAVLPTMTPDQLAQITSGIPTAINPGVQVAEISSGMGGVTPEMLDPSLTLPAETPFTPPAMPGAMTGAPTPLPSSFTEKSALASLMDKSKYLTKAKDWFDKQDDEDLALYGAGAGLGLSALKKKKGSPESPGSYSGPLSKLSYDPDRYQPQQIAQPDPYKPRYAGGGNVESYAFGNRAVGKNPMGLGFPNRATKQVPPAPLSQFAVPAARAPVAQPTPYKARYAQGGISDLGGYSDGGRMLKGPGDGMSDNIPASIAGKQPARLANEEFVVPADVVSHLGNGSSEAGAKQLYKMMDRVRQARTGKKKQGKQINPNKYMPV